jgi:hypothetical protein
VGDRPGVRHDLVLLLSLDAGDQIELVIRWVIEILVY